MDQRKGGGDRESEGGEIVRSGNPAAGLYVESVHRTADAVHCPG